MRASACKVCDRKFYVREIVKASRVTIEEQESEITNLRRQMEEHVRRCDEIEADYKRSKELIEGEIEKNRAVKKKNKKVKKTLGLEVQSMTEDCSN